MFTVVLDEANELGKVVVDLEHFSGEHQVFNFQLLLPGHLKVLLVALKYRQGKSLQTLGSGLPEPRHRAAPVFLSPGLLILLFSLPLECLASTPSDS